MSKDKVYEFLKEERDYLKTTVSLSEGKLKKNKEKLEIVEQMLKEQFGWVESEETTHTNYL